MTMTERKVIKAKVGLLGLAEQLGSLTQACRAHRQWVHQTGVRASLLSRTFMRPTRNRSTGVTIGSEASAGQHWGRDDDEGSE
jgi:hypothetical protein